MNSSLSYVVAAGLAVVISAPAASAQSTTDTLGSTRVTHRVRLQPVDAGEGGRPKTVVQVGFDNDESGFHDLRADRTFLTTGPISVTIPAFNPLKTAVTVKVDDVADPTHAVLEKLVEGMFGAAKTLGADVALATTFDLSAAGVNVAMAPAVCKEAVRAAERNTGSILSVLDDTRWRAETVAQQYRSWAAAIDDGFKSRESGPNALRAASRLADTWRTEGKTRLKTIDQPLELMNAALSSTADVSVCDRAVRAVYSIARAARPEARRDALVEILDAVEATQEALEGYARIERWSEAGGFRDFIARHSIEPTGKHMRKVSVTFSRISYASPNPSSTMVTKKEDAATATFLVRRYMAWVPEIGVGLTYSNPKRPKYGTAKNEAGETVIGEAKSDSSSLDPSILVNFVCGFCRFTAVTPMFQLGASTSKTTPAFFVGGGLRVLATAKGDFALGTGLIFPWAKQLKDGSAPGTVIDGTAALENHLEWRRVEGKHVYFSIQYKF